MISGHCQRLSGWLLCWGTALPAGRAALDISSMEAIFNEARTSRRGRPPAAGPFLELDISRSPDQHLDTVWVSQRGSPNVAGGRVHRLLPSSISKKLSTRARQNNTTLRGSQWTVTISMDRQQVGQRGHANTLGAEPVVGRRSSAKLPRWGKQRAWRCITIHAGSLQRSLKEPCTVARPCPSCGSLCFDQPHGRGQPLSDLLGYLCKSSSCSSTNRSAYCCLVQPWLSSGVIHAAGHGKSHTSQLSCCHVSPIRNMTVPTYPS